MQLKYLFTAEYDDGTVIEQTNDDRSAANSSKSAFYDVLQKDGLARFSLLSEDDSYTVDLTDGHFEINGIPFEAHGQNFIPQNLRLIYFRETRLEFKPDHDGEIKPDKHYVNRYFIGWQANNDKGRNVKQTIAIS